MREFFQLRGLVRFHQGATHEVIVHWFYIFCCFVLVAMLSSCHSEPPQNEHIETDTPTVPKFPEGSLLHHHALNGSVLRLEHDDLCAQLDLHGPVLDARLGGHGQDLVAYFLQIYADNFFVSEPSSAWRVRSSQADPLGGAQVRLNQYFGGLEVWPGELSVRVNDKLHITQIQGNYLPEPKMPDLTPSINEDAARRLASNALKAYVGDCASCPIQLLIYLDPQGNGWLAYRVTVVINRLVTRNIYVAALDGRVLANIDEVYQ